MASYRIGMGGSYVCNSPNPRGCLHFMTTIDDTALEEFFVEYNVLKPRPVR